MTSIYPNCWGLQKSLVNLWYIIDGDLKKQRCIGNIISSHNRDLNELIARNLSKRFKKKILVWMKCCYRDRIFKDIKCLTDYEKRHLYSAIRGNQREVYRRLHK